MFAVGLTRSTGGTLVTPMASATDGLFDLCIIGGMSRRDFARMAMRVKRGEHLGEDGVQYAQVRAVTIESPDPIPVNVDGEMSNANRLTYRARSRDLWVHVARLPRRGGKKKAFAAGFLVLRPCHPDGCEATRDLPLFTLERGLDLGDVFAVLARSAHIVRQRLSTDRAGRHGDQRGGKHVLGNFGLAHAFALSSLLPFASV
jgi:hypothetical protein